MCDSSAEVSLRIIPCTNLTSRKGKPVVFASFDSAPRPACHSLLFFLIAAFPSSVLPHPINPADSLPPPPPGMGLQRKLKRPQRLSLNSDLSLLRNQLVHVSRSSQSYLESYALAVAATRVRDSSLHSDGESLIFPDRGDSI